MEDKSCNDKILTHAGCAKHKIPIYAKIGSKVLYFTLDPEVPYLYFTTNGLGTYSPMSPKVHGWEEASVCFILPSDD